MNQMYAKNLVLVMLVAMGLFNLFRGIELLRSKGKKTAGIWTIVVLRMILGLLLLAAPFPLLYYLRSGQS
ncbi:MAG: hypothetical protein V1798_02120 [Pseudomonadota bacterium]